MEAKFNPLIQLNRNAAGTFFKLIFLPLGVILLLLLIFYRPLLALYYQQQAGVSLRAVIPVGDNDYGGFACLRPFIEDLNERDLLLNAAMHLRKAEALSPRQAHIFYVLGKTYCLLGDYENAIAAFQRFGELRPRNPAGYLEMGFALLQACPPNGKCADGLNTYDTWRQAGVRAEDFLVMAEKAHSKGDYENALLWYQNAQRMGLELRSTIAYLRYLTLSQSGLNEEADQALVRAIEIDRGWINEEERLRAWFRYGVILYDRMDFVKAMKVFKKAIEFDVHRDKVRRELSHVYRFLGLIAFQQDDLKTAHDYFVTSLDIDPTNIWSHVHYGWILYYLDKANLQKSIKEFDIALDLAGEQSIVWNDVIRHLIKWGEFDLAKTYCQKSFDLGIGDQVTNCTFVN